MRDSINASSPFLWEFADSVACRQDNEFFLVVAFDEADIHHFAFGVAAEEREFNQRQVVAHDGSALDVISGRILVKQ